MKIIDFYLMDLVLIFIQFYAANAISCFQCDHWKPGCADLTRDNKSSPYYLPCNILNSTAFCRKTIQTILAHDFPVRITRECGWITTKPKENKCFKYDTQHKFDTSCQCYEDGCNTAFTSTPNSFVLITTFGVVISRLIQYAL